MNGPRESPTVTDAEGAYLAGWLYAFSWAQDEGAGADGDVLRRAARALAERCGVVFGEEGGVL